MSITEMLEYFDLLTDKVGSPYFTDDEKYSFINRSQIEYLKKLLPSNEGGVVNIETDHVVFSNAYTLVYETGVLNPSSTGEVSRTSVQSALNAVSGSTEPFVFPMNVSYNGLPCKYTRHNDWYEMEGNTFKKGTALEPRYRQEATKFVVSPAVATAEVRFTLLKQPKDVGVGVDSEYPSHTHKTIIELAVDLASVAMRDAELNQANQSQLNQ